MATRIRYNGDDIGTLYLEDIGKRTDNPRNRGLDRYVSHGADITIPSTGEVLISRSTGQLSVWSGTDITGFDVGVAPLTITDV